MNIPMLQACIEGYQEHLFDMQCIAVHQGYWAGYFQSKKPKSANYILERLNREHKKERRKASGKKLTKPEVDVEKFLQREERRMAYLASRRKGK